jgi:hypothetical protein
VSDRIPLSATDLEFPARVGAQADQSRTKGTTWAVLVVEIPREGLHRAVTAHHPALVDRRPLQEEGSGGHTGERRPDGAQPTVRLGAGPTRECTVCGPASYEVVRSGSAHGNLIIVRWKSSVVRGTRSCLEVNQRRKSGSCL